MKYPINKEFIPLRRIAPPILTARLAGVLGRMLRAPRWLFRDKALRVRRIDVCGYRGERVEMLEIVPKNAADTTRALVYCHGGGFFFGASGHHYRMAKEYAIGAACKLYFIQYNLAPKNPFPHAPEDCYAALRYVYDNAQRLGIDGDMIAIGGDSAGGALAAACVQMARDRGTDIPRFQLLIYPVTDRRMRTESMRIFEDTPMWNARLSRIMWKSYAPAPKQDELPYASPAEAQSFSGLCDAYVETAEFDCLRDEGREYAESLRAGGCAVILNETRGTMHAFDLKRKAPTSDAAICARINYMKEMYL